MLRIVLVLAILLQADLAFSKQPEGGWQCWADASARYNIPVDLLYAIARVETGNKGRLISKPNRNGTYDIGLMQINSMHLPRLAKIGITERDLIEKPCVNLHVGAMILSEMIARYGYTWVAIGAYNAGTHEKRVVYAKKVYAMHDRILRERERKRVADTDVQRRLAELREQLRAEQQRLAMLESEIDRGGLN